MKSTIEQEKTTGTMPKTKAEEFANVERRIGEVTGALSRLEGEKQRLRQEAETQLRNDAVSGRLFSKQEQERGNAALADLDREIVQEEKMLTALKDILPGVQIEAAKEERAALIETLAEFDKNRLAPLLDEFRSRWNATVTALLGVAAAYTDREKIEVQFNEVSKRIPLPSRGLLMPKATPETAPAPFLTRGDFEKVMTDTYRVPVAKIAARGERGFA